jgi:alkanesulfonate monooxygenase SsuD/methylene tetrahydromethanopterin reductase-like flavin-dependent oxidoreductase (luciferase family)
MGARPATWSYLRDYVVAFRRLLAGDTVTWQGSRLKMMHPAGFAPQRPIDVPVLISAIGPKGLDVATELADGLFSIDGQTRSAAQFDWASLAVHGTVLDDGEALDSPRVRAAAGHILDRCEACGRAAPQRAVPPEWYSSASKSGIAPRPSHSKIDGRSAWLPKGELPYSCADRLHPPASIM